MATISQDELLLALGEKTAENFALRRDNRALAEALQAARARIAELENAQAESAEQKED